MKTHPKILILAVFSISTGAIAQFNVNSPPATWTPSYAPLIHTTDGPSGVVVATPPPDQLGYIYTPTIVNGVTEYEVSYEPIFNNISQGKTISLQTIAQGTGNSPSGFDQLTAPVAGIPVPMSNNSSKNQNLLAVADQAGKIWIVDLNKTSNNLAILLDLTNSATYTVAPGTNPVNFATLSATYDERGLWGIAFDPGFVTNGFFYTYNSDICVLDSTGTECTPAPDFTYPAPHTFAPTLATTNPPSAGVTLTHPNHQSVLRKWYINPKQFSTSKPELVKEILRIDKPYSNHNAGIIIFGPDNMLYVCVADGGNADDFGLGHFQPTDLSQAPLGNAQNTSIIFGKLLRIDPNPTAKKIKLALETLSANGAYGIPNNNPFFAAKNSNASVAGGPQGCTDGGCDEIFAYGFRNPYSMAFDNGLLFIGDVGQDNVEAIKVIDISNRKNANLYGGAGTNFGWSEVEGSLCFVFDIVDQLTGPSFVLDTNSPNCAYGYNYGGTGTPSLTQGIVFPVSEYDHTQGSAIIGGQVYRGDDPDLKGLQNRYIFGDYKATARPFFAFVDGRIFYLDKPNVSAKDVMQNGIDPQTGLHLSGIPILFSSINDDMPATAPTTNPSPLGVRRVIFGFAKDINGAIYVLGKWATYAGTQNPPTAPPFPSFGPRGNFGFIKKIVSAQ